MTSLVNLLSNNDTQTIIQSVRLLEVVLHYSLDSENESITLKHPLLLEKMGFILQNSMNGIINIIFITKNLLKSKVYTSLLKIQYCRRATLWNIEAAQFYC